MTKAQLNTGIKKVAKATNRSVWDVLAKLNQKDDRTWFLIRQAT